jgi:ATP synthase I chain
MRRDGGGAKLVADVPGGPQDTSPYIVPEAFGASTLRRIDWLTIVLGGAGALWAARHWGWRGGAGLALGAALSWINFRWLKSSVRSFGAVATLPAAPASPGSPVATTAGAPPVRVVRVPLSAYLKFFGRFALLLGVVYVILTRSWLPVVPVIAGLFAAAAATVVGLVFELAASRVR